MHASGGRLRTTIVCFCSAASPFTQSVDRVGPAVGNDACGRGARRVVARAVAVEVPGEARDRARRGGGEGHELRRSAARRASRRTRRRAPGRQAGGRAGQRRARERPASGRSAVARVGPHRKLRAAWANQSPPRSSARSYHAALVEPGHQLGHRLDDVRRAVGEALGLARVGDAGEHEDRLEPRLESRPRRRCPCGRRSSRSSPSGRRSRSAPSASSAGSACPTKYGLHAGRAADQRGHRPGRRAAGPAPTARSGRGSWR